MLTPSICVESSRSLCHRNRRKSTPTDTRHLYVHEAPTLYILLIPRQRFLLLFFFFGLFVCLFIFFSHFLISLLAIGRVSEEKKKYITVAGKETRPQRIANNKDIVLIVRYIYQAKDYIGGAGSVTVIVSRNGYGDPSSNPERCYLHFT